MPNLTQDDRLLQLYTPLGKDKLLIRSIDGMEGMSQLFSYRIEAFASNDEVIDFSKLIGQPVCVDAALDRSGQTTSKRYFHGVVQTVTRGARGNTNTAYSLQVVPGIWLLTRTTQSRIFQQKNVTDIVKAVLGTIPYVWEATGTFEPRDYCVQYRESDFDFISRLMEEEGLYYFFRHSDTEHKMVISNTPTSNVELPHSPTLYFDPDTGGYEDIEIVYAWEKAQTLRSGKTTLWDHSFELPHKNLEAQELITETVTVGTVTHKLKVGGNDKMELYDYPGGYAERFDGISKSGGEQSGELQKIFEDNKRTVKIRMQQEAVNSLIITGYTGFFGIIPGFKFNLERHYEDDDCYLITRSHFTIPQMGGYSAEGQEGPPPEVVFNCIPHVLPFRPQCVTSKPVIHGTQTAVVAGPSGDEIFTDKYGRIKVQFLWDRSLPHSAESSCWVRCAFPWAGKNFGFISIPRIGHEVVIAFEEGDPDQPICVGSVFNADTMPPWALPDNKTQSGFQSRTEKGGSENLNVLQFEDKKQAEFIFIQAEKDIHTRVKNDSYSNYGQDVHRYIERDLIEQTKNEVHRLVNNSVFEEVKSNTQKKTGGNEDEKVVGNVNRDIGGNLNDKIGGNHVEGTTGNYEVKAMSIAFEASTSISFKVGGSEVVISQSGVAVKGSGTVAVTAPMVNINSGPGSPAKSPGSPTAASVKAPKPIKEAMKSGKTGHVTYAGGAGQNAPAHSLPPTGSRPNSAKVQSEKSNSNEKIPENHFIEIEVMDLDNIPVYGEPFEVVTPEGTLATGTTDQKGYARVDGIQPGNATVRFPQRDKSVVE